MSAEHLLTVTGASFRYPDSDRSVFEDVSFTLERGDILAILGPNGAGKSTLLNCVSGFKPMNHGEIILNGNPLSKISKRQLAQWIGYVPQNQVRTYDFSVREYVAMGRAPYLGFGRAPSKEDYRLVDDTLERMNLQHLKDKSYTKVSGGESQQIMIARVLVQQPNVIMLDEPANHLDYGNQIRMLRLLRSLAEEGYGIILTTHMPDHAFMLSAKAGILDREGHFIVGDANTLLDEAKLYELYRERIIRTYVPGAERKACIPAAL